MCRIWLPVSGKYCGEGHMLHPMASLREGTKLPLMPTSSVEVTKVTGQW